MLKFLSNIVLSYLYSKIEPYDFQSFFYMCVSGLCLENIKGEILKYLKVFDVYNLKKVFQYV